MKPDLFARDDRQLGLFETPPPDGPGPEIQQLADALPKNLRLGTSSWTFPGWAGIVYFRRYGAQQRFVRESLQEYARYPLFRTVGIDRTFYGPMTSDELAAYAAMLPEDFRCCMKVWGEVTTRVFSDHPRMGPRAGRVNPRFLDAELFMDEVATPVIEGFRDHIGPLIVEIPPSRARLDLRAWEQRLDRFLSEVPQGLRYAVEVREARMMTPRYFEILSAHGAAHVFNFWSAMPTIGTQLARPGSLSAPFVVARLMIPPGRRYADEKAAMAPFDRIARVEQGMRDDVLALIEAAGDREVFIIANNKAEGCSPLTLRGLAEQLTRAPRR